MILRMILAASR